jgi:hypothetical protein
MDDHIAKPVKLEDRAEALERWLPEKKPKEAERLAGIVGDAPPRVSGLCSIGQMEFLA